MRRTEQTCHVENTYPVIGRHYDLHLNYRSFRVRLEHRIVAVRLAVGVRALSRRLHFHDTTRQRNATDVATCCAEC